MPSSNDDRFLAELAHALQEVKLDAIVVGNTASILNGAPVLTNDVDLLVRDTALNRKKLQRLAAQLHGTGPLKIADLTDVERIYGARVPIDILYEMMAGNLSFASVKARSHPEPVGQGVLVVAALEDIIKSKRAANRAKDRAVLPILEDTLKVRRELFRDNVNKSITELAVLRRRK